MRFGELVGLLGVGFGNAAWNARLAAREARRFSGCAWWWRLKGAMGREWLLDDPFRVVRRESAAAGLSEDDAVYGETPVLTAWDLLATLEVGPTDRVVDLGCGRGTVPLVAALAFGAAGAGLDMVPTFVERASRVAERLGLEGRVRFLRADFRSDPLPRGTVYFLAGTTLEPASWRRVGERLARVPAGTRAVSLSAPLPASQWEILRREPRPFTWGTATVYVQRRFKGRRIRAAR